MKWPLFAGVLAALFLCSAPPPAVADQQNLNSIVAVVDKDVILKSDLDDAVAQIKQRMGARAEQIPPDNLRSQVLDHLILVKLQLQRAKRDGVQVSDSEVNTAINRLAKGNGMTRQQFIGALSAHGTDFTQLHKRVRDQMLIDKVRQKEVAGRVVVTDTDVKRYLQSQSLRVQSNREYHIRHILIAVNENADARDVKAAHDRLGALRKRIVDGDQSFGDVAIAHSDGQKALKGGDLGWLHGDYLPTLFSDVVPKLSPGKVSPVFRGPSGFHLIELVGIRDAQGHKQTAKSDMVHEVRLRQILIKPNQILNNERAKEKAQALRKRIAAGDDFAELARKQSDDPHTANQGGDMGWMPAGKIPPDFGSHIKDLKKGRVTEPFRSGNGWHLVKVEGRRERDLSKERLRQRARQALGQRKMNEKSETWLHRIRDEAYVDIRMPGYTGSGKTQGKNVAAQSGSDQ